jgi:hypothetical protein|tara:strand:+ start:975 stop:1163 length:189 start_codon:yes stop_codon:yes gene_type:complete
MPVKVREVPFYEYMQSRRKNTKYPTDYLAQAFIWFSKTSFINGMWLLMKIIKAWIRLVNKYG